MKIASDSIGPMIRERRRVLGLGQQDVAELAGISVHTLHNLERPDSNPTLEVLSKVLEVLGLEIQVVTRDLSQDRGAP